MKLRNLLRKIEQKLNELRVQIVELNILLIVNNVKSVNYNNLNYIERKNIREEYIKIQK